VLHRVPQGCRSAPARDGPNACHGRPDALHLRDPDAHRTTPLRIEYRLAAAARDALGTGQGIGPRQRQPRDGARGDRMHKVPGGRFLMQESPDPVLAAAREVLGPMPP
jgi:hypothetical protein